MLQRASAARATERTGVKQRSEQCERTERANAMVGRGRRGKPSRFVSLRCCENHAVSMTSRGADPLSMCASHLISSQLMVSHVDRRCHTNRSKQVVPERQARHFPTRPTLQPTVDGSCITTQPRRASVCITQCLQLVPHSSTTPPARSVVSRPPHERVMARWSGSRPAESVPAKSFRSGDDAVC